MKKTINLSSDFNKTPAGRFFSDGDYSGEHFRKNYLIPAFKDSNTKIIEVILDNLDGIGSSFWEEAFGGLIRKENINYEEIKKKITFKCDDDDTLIPLINSLIEDANKSK